MQHLNGLDLVSRDLPRLPRLNNSGETAAGSIQFSDYFSPPSAPYFQEPVAFSPHADFNPSASSNAGIQGEVSAYPEPETGGSVQSAGAYEDPYAAESPPAEAERRTDSSWEADSRKAAKQNGSVKSLADKSRVEGSNSEAAADDVAHSISGKVRNLDDTKTPADLENAANAQRSGSRDSAKNLNRKDFAARSLRTSGSESEISSGLDKHNHDSVGRAGDAVPDALGIDASARTMGKGDGGSAKNRQPKALRTDSDGSAAELRGPGEKSAVSGNRRPVASESTEVLIDGDELSGEADTVRRAKAEHGKARNAHTVHAAQTEAGSAQATATAAAGGNAGSASLGSQIPGEGSSTESGDSMVLAELGEARGNSSSDGGGADTDSRGDQTGGTFSNLMFRDSASRAAPRNAGEIQVFFSPESMPSGSVGLSSDSAVGSATRNMSAAELMEAFRQQLKGNLGSDIVRQARYVLRGQNSGEISLILKPEKLGRVRIRMNLEDKSIAGKIFVENMTVKEAFEGTLEDLREAFLEQGFEDLNLEVALDQRDEGEAQQQGAEPPLTGERIKSLADRLESNVASAKAYLHEYQDVNILA